MVISLAIRCITYLTCYLLRRREQKREIKRLEVQFLKERILQSLTFFQQGLEILSEYLGSLDESLIGEEGRNKWNSLIQSVMNASSMANFTQIPHVCFALRQVIPYLSLIKGKIDPESPAFVRAKEAFQDSSLLASAVFQSTEVRSFSHVFLYSFATAMKVNAAILQCFISPELLATVVIGHIEQLQFSPIFEKFIRKEKSRKATDLPVTITCVSQLFILGASLVPLCRPQDKQQFLKKLHTASYTSSVASLIDQYCIIGQTLYGQQGVNDEDFDGPTSIAVNSKGHIIVADSRNQKIKALSATGKRLGNCDPLPDELGNSVPLAIAINQHDEMFALFYKESTKVNTIVKFDAIGRFLCSFDTRHCFRGVRHDVVPCGMSVSSLGLIYLGDKGNECIYILEPDGASLSLRKVIKNPGLETDFSFCLGPNDKLIVATRRGVGIYYENGRLLKNVALNWHKKYKVKAWKPLAVAYDADLKQVVVITAGEITSTPRYFKSKTIHLKPMGWFLSAESYAQVGTMEFPLGDIEDTNGRFDMVVGNNGLWCVTEATHRIHCFTMMHHLIRP